MRAQNRSERRFKFILLLWSLLFTKCFTLEFLVREYHVPVNSFLYVWCLSVGMASAATAVYGQLEKISMAAMLSKRISQLKLGMLIATVALVLSTLVDSDWSSRIPLAIAAALMGLRKSLASSPASDPGRWLGAIAWGIIAIAMCFISPAVGYALFAAGIFITSSIPRARELLAPTQK